jgi:hypothetical protein
VPLADAIPDTGVQAGSPTKRNAWNQGKPAIKGFQRSTKSTPIPYHVNFFYASTKYIRQPKEIKTPPNGGGV